MISLKAPLPPRRGSPRATPRPWRQHRCASHARFGADPGGSPPRDGAILITSNLRLPVGTQPTTGELAIPPPPKEREPHPAGV